MNKGKKPAQTTDEIIQDLADNKERQLSRTRGQGLYPKERNEVVEATISRLVGMSFKQMAKLATSEHIALSDVTELKKRSLIYLKACEENRVFPSMAGLARCLGYSRRELEVWRSNHQNTDTAKWLDSFADACAETLHQAALTKSTSEITTIFLSKALYGMKETQNLILTQGANVPHEEIDIQAIEEDYKHYLKELEENKDNDDI